MTTLPLYTALGENRRLLADLLPLPGPISAYVQTVSVCNFHCHLCPVSDTDYFERYGKGRMSLEDFRTVVLKLNSSGALKVVRLYGLGEPLLDSTLPEKVAFAASLGLRTEVTSNGSLMTEEIAERLMRAGLQYLRFSIYGLEAAELKAYIGRKADPRDILRRVGLCWEVRQRLKCATRIHVTALDNQVERVQAEYGQYCDSLSGTPRHNFAEFDAENANALTGKKEVCPMPFYTVQVQWNGDVMPCCVAPATLVVGNLFRQSLDEVWNGKELQGIRNAHIERRRASIPACAKCNFPLVMPDNLDQYHPTAK